MRLDSLSTFDLSVIIWSRQRSSTYLFTMHFWKQSRSGDTEVPSSHLSRYIQTLQTGGDSISNNSSNLEMKFGIGCLGSTDIPILSGSNSMKSVALTTTTHSSQWPLLERQYKLVISFRAKDFNVVSG